MSARRSRSRAVAAAAVLLLFLPSAVSLAVAPAALAFDPGVIANTANDPLWNLAEASAFRLNLENVTPYACPVNCTITPSSEVNITIDGAARLSGTFSEPYRITVRGPSSFAANYTTIAVVIKGNASDVVIQPDADTERSGSQAYTKNVNGTSTMNLTLLPSNRSGNITLNVIGYVGDGNRTSHGNTELYAIATKAIEMRAQRIIPVNATIVNRANVSVTSVNVSFFAKGPNDSDFKNIGNSTVPAVNANGTSETGVAWDATWADPALYMVKVVIDPLHQHPDALEENNVRFFQVNLGPPEPDTHGQLVGNAFLFGTLIVLFGVGIGLYIYNRRYE
jgi:hypothetical protein